MNKQETKIQLLTKVEQISKVIEQNNLVLFNVDGWNSLLPKEFAESFLQARELLPRLEEYEEFHNWLLLEENIPIDELLEIFRTKKKNE